MLRLRTVRSFLDHHSARIFTHPGKILSSFTIDFKDYGRNFQPLEKPCGTFSLFHPEQASLRAKRLIFKAVHGNVYIMQPVL
jgi:hypothetical protein